MTIIKTPWGTKQNLVDGLPMLTKEEEDILRQEWRTPPEFIEALQKISHYPIELDVAASNENTVAPYYFHKENSGLCHKWITKEIRHAFCNPGFNDMWPWISHADGELIRLKLDSYSILPDRVKSFEIDILGLCAPSTEWFSRAAKFATTIYLLSPRVQFLPPDPRIVRTSNSRENALFRFSEKPGPVEIKVWQWKE